MQHATPILLAMSIFSLAANADTNTVTDVFQAPNGKTVAFTCIKHASLRIQYDGQEIQVDPVSALDPATDYSAFPKADLVLVTHEHFDHFDKEAVATLRKEGSAVYIAGDTEDIPEMEDVKNIDVAFLPVNQPYTMTPEQAAKAARVIKPKVLFPYHYGQTPIRKVAELLDGSGIDVRIRDYR